MSFIRFLVILSLFPSAAVAKEAADPIVVQVLGTPASGKTDAVESVIDALQDTKLKNELKTLRIFDLDVERENIASLPGDTQLFLTYKAIKLFKDAAQTSAWPQFHLSEITKFINGKLKTLFHQQGVEISYKNNALYINKTLVNDTNFGEISSKIVAQSDRVFKQLGPWELLTHINRYIQLLSMMESMYLHQNLSLIEVGTYAQPILERLSKLRQSGYKTLTIYTQPQSVAVNLLLNSVRAAQGGHFADPDYLYSQYMALEELVHKKNTYFENAEHVLVIRTEKDFDQLDNKVKNMSTKDNNQERNKNKIIDLLIIINTLKFDTILKKIVEDQNERHLKNRALSIFLASLKFLKNKLPSSKKNMEEIQKKIDPLKIALNNLDIKKNVQEASHKNKYIQQSELYKFIMQK